MLKLLNLWIGRDLAGIGLPIPGGTAFQLEFHIMVGLLMALFYGLALEPVLRGSAWAKGLSYAALVWLANAAVILPLLGEGFAGSHNLGLPGLTYFAAAHTIFFVLTAVLYARFFHVERNQLGIS